MTQTICALIYFALTSVYGWQLAEVGATPLEAGAFILLGACFWMLGIFYGKAGAKA